MQIISPYLTFPSISWWQKVIRAGMVALDSGEHFEKMTGRNRYRISGANNPILLSVPLINGRNQHVAMRDVRIYNGEKWQVRHWRTLISVYNRTPFFEHYEHSLIHLFEQPFEYLTEFNLATLQWVMAQLKLSFEIQRVETYQKEYPPEFTDLRPAPLADNPMPEYYQVFAGRIGFQPDLSILDLLFSEGPAAGPWLQQMG